MYLDLLMKSLKTKFDSEEREGIHVSDLTLCLRKAVFKKLNPTPITAKELNFFTSGRAIHDAIQMVANVNEGMFEIEKEIEFQGIQGHIDLYDTKANIPIECKSSRTKEIKEPKKFHIDQLKYYMAFTGADKGAILYQALMHFDETPFFEFEITMTEEERNKQKERGIIKRELYTKALDAKDPFKVEGVMEDPDLSWLCKSCPHLQACKDDVNKKVEHSK